jgi:hypothetical protein
MAQEETQMNGGQAEFPYQSEIAMDSTLGSYTFEGWVKNPAYSMISKKGGFYLSYDMGFEYYSPRLPSVAFGNCSGNICTSYVYDLPACNIACLANWFHFAYVYDHDTGKGAFFWNGQLLDDNAMIPNASTEPILIKAGLEFDEIRISDNIRYNATFTPPTAPFTCDANIQRPCGILMRSRDRPASTIPAERWIILPALSVERKPKALQDFIIICQLWQDRRGENGKASAV